MEESTLQNDTPTRSVDSDGNTDVFGSLNAELSEVASKSVERALESGLKRLPPFGETEPLLGRLRWNYLAKVDLLEIYNGRNVFSLDHVQPVSIRRAAAGLYLQSQDVREEAAPRSPSSNLTPIEDDKSDITESLPLPTEHDLQSLEAELQRLRARARQLKLTRNKLRKKATESISSVRTSSGSMWELPSALDVVIEHAMSSCEQMSRRQCDDSLRTTTTRTAKRKVVGKRVRTDEAVAKSGATTARPAKRQTLKERFAENEAVVKSGTTNRRKIVKRNDFSSSFTDPSTSASDHDIVFGRNPRLLQRPANLLYRYLIKARRDEFLLCSETRRLELVQEIIRKAVHTGGRFLKQVGGKTVDGEWQPICVLAPEATVLKLTRQRLVHHQYRSGPTRELQFEDQFASENDVILGECARLAQRPANVLFQSLILERATDWHGSSDSRKEEIALETVRKVLDTCGRFLNRVGEQIVNGESKPVYQVFDEVEALRVTKHRFCKIPPPPRAITCPTDYDVIFGRRHWLKQRPANRQFRSHATERAKEYRVCGNDVRRDEIEKETIQTVLDSGGRFLKEVVEIHLDGGSKTVTYEVADEATTLRLTKQRFYRTANVSTGARSHKQSRQEARLAPVPDGIGSTDSASPADHGVMLGKNLPQPSANLLFRSHIKEQAIEYCSDARKDEIVEQAVRLVLDSGGGLEHRG